jgi:hypothetical protein
MDTLMLSHLELPDIKEEVEGELLASNRAKRDSLNQSPNASTPLDGGSSLRPTPKKSTTNTQLDQSATPKLSIQTKGVGITAEAKTSSPMIRNKSPKTAEKVINTKGLWGDDLIV